MAQNQSKENGKVVFLVAIAIVAVVTIYAIVSQLWFLIAIPVGLLFGFFLQKGDLCGSSAFSEVILMKDRSKVFGLWIAIVVGMVGIALMDIFNLVTLNPKPFIWVNYIVGGIIFGVGIVLAGGCVSGCLYKTGTGNLNSMAALVGIPIGIALVVHGPLHSFFLAMKKHVIPGSTGGSVTLSSLLGLPFWLLAVLFLLITIIFVLIKNKNSSNKSSFQENKTLKEMLFKAWRPWQAGIAIGLLVIPAYLSSASSGRNYPLGVTHGVLDVELLATDSNLNYVWQKSDPIKSKAIVQQQTNQRNSTPKPTGKKVSLWLVLLVSSLVVGSWVSARMAGKAKLLPKPPEQTVTAFFGGILVGTGAALGTGCVIGNIVSGWALMSVGSVLFGIVVILTNWVTTFLYLMGRS